MSDWLTGVVETLGYPGIALLMVLEIPVPVIQSEIVMGFAGFSAARGALSLPGVVVAGVVGSQLGSLALYGVARQLPEARVRGFVSDHGAWLGLSDDTLRRAEERFERHGSAAVLVGRLLPGMRSFIALPAGLLGMSLPRFAALNLVGTTFWVTVLAVLGAQLGDRYRLVDRYSGWVTAVLLGALALFVVYRLVVVVRHYRARRG